jgi:hypothetical protein
MAANERNIPAVLPQVVPAKDAKKPETGTVRRDFLEAVVVALLAFTIGLTVGAALCISRHHQTRAQEELQWLN